MAKKVSKKVTKKAAKKAPVTKNQSSKNVAALVWVTTLPMGFLPGLAVYFFRKNDPYVTSQTKEALNWGITVVLLQVGWFFMILFMGASAVTSMGMGSDTATMGSVIGFILFYLSIFVLLLSHLVFCIWGAISTSKGRGFKIPLAIRLLK